MPAIQLARLKHQTAKLVDLFDQPAEFVHELYQLLDLYSERTHRPGQSGEPPPLLESFKAPPPVLRQIIIELKPWVDSNPDKAYGLIDKLWAEPYLEIRILAAWILGSIPITSAEIILNQVQTWIWSDIDNQLMDIVLDQGLEKVRLESPDALINRIGQWLSKPEIFSQQVGLRALIPLLSSQQYENLPIIFHLLAPFARKAPLRIRPDILELLQTLARRSPRETAYFLHQNLEAPENPDTAMLTRQCLSAFPLDIQAKLRSALREISTQKRP